jgi:hypothetical protein
MAFWNPTTGVITVKVGTNPNDGTGDSIRNAFITIDNNFGNISTFLSGGAGAISVDFLTSNITNLNGSFGNITTVNATNLTTASINGTNGNFISNITLGNLNANTGIHNAGVTTLNGNTYAANVAISGVLSIANQINTSANINAGGSIIPTANLSYDIGSPTNFFRNLYVQGLTQVNTISLSASASILELNSGLAPGGQADVGVLNKYNVSSSNVYAYMGLQYATGNFIYKSGITSDPTAGNNIVVGGSYGNVQFGSQLLSNTTTSTSTTTGALIVAGGAGIAGNLNAGTVYTTRVSATTANISNATFGNVAGNLWVDGNIYSGGQPVLTPASFPYGQVYGQTIFGNSNPSTSTSSGALIVPLGGLGVGGNINAGAVYTTTVNATSSISSAGTITATNGFNGNINTLYAQQPIFTSGLITQINSGNLIYTGSLYGSSGSTYSTQGNVSLQQPGTGLWVTANINAGGYFGPVYGSQTNITQVGTLGTLTVNGNAIIGNIITGTISGTLSGVATTALTVTSSAQSAITSVGTLTGLTVSGNTIVNNTLYAQGIYDNGTRVVSTSGGAGNLSISNGNITLPTTGPGLATAGNASYIPVIGTDAFGRITSLSNIAVASVSTTITLAGSSGSGSVSGGGTLTFSSTNGVTIAVGSSYANISTPQDIRSTASPTFVAVTANITGNVIGNVTGNVLTAAQPNITTIGNLTSLTVGGTTTTYGNILPGANVSYNLGSTTAWWNTVYGTAVHAQYADLAEMYTSDAEYEPGTVLIFGGDAEVTVTNIAGDTRVAGAVSTNPAYLMNTETAGVALALRGRVPVRVVGKVTKGDLLITSTHPGCAQSDGRNSNSGAAVFAKAIESSNEPGEKIIEAVIL